MEHWANDPLFHVSCSLLLLVLLLLLFSLSLLLEAMKSMSSCHCCCPHRKSVAIVQHIVVFVHLLQHVHVLLSLFVVALALALVWRRFVASVAEVQVYVTIVHADFDLTIHSKIYCLLWRLVPPLHQLLLHRRRRRHRRHRDYYLSLDAVDPIETLLLTTVELRVVSVQLILP
jgi:hypothetical protein